ncbi:MAG: hypothetical protein OXK21_06080 [Chloroflexota bacterium]|nr:hypothetical protein [Chloroflexota bacterium]
MAHVEPNALARDDEAAQPDGRQRSRGPWARAALELLRRPKAVFGIAVIVLLYGGGVLAPVLAPSASTTRTCWRHERGRARTTCWARTSWGATC